MENEKRVHPRLAVLAQMKVTGAAGTASGTLLDLSRGGARFQVPPGSVSAGERVRLALPWAGTEEISVDADVVRIASAQSFIEVSVRFGLVAPAQRRTLDELIVTIAAGKGGQGRKHPRIIKRMPLRLPDAQQLKAMATDVSRGGLGMTVSKALALEQELAIVLPDGAGEELLVLFARVVHQTPLPGGRFRVGCEFRKMLPERRACLDAFLSALLEAPGAAP